MSFFYFNDLQGSLVDHSDTSEDLSSKFTYFFNIIFMTIFIEICKCHVIFTTPFYSFFVNSVSLYVMCRLYSYTDTYL